MPRHLEVPPVKDPELRRSPSPPPSRAHVTYNDKYVVVYDFSDTGISCYDHRHLQTSCI